MQMRITHTPNSNVDYKNMAVLDNELNSSMILDWNCIVDVHDTTDKINPLKQVQVSGLSAYDHRLIIDGHEHKILHTFSKENFNELLPV